MDRLQGTVGWLALASGLSHLFCCGIPFVVSVVSLVATTGFFVSLPAGLEYLHDFIHGHEVLVLSVSGLILLLGWVLHAYAKSLDCRRTGCDHPPCGSSKARSLGILVIATALFVVNAVSYFFLHH